MYLQNSYFNKMYFQNNPQVGRLSKFPDSSLSSISLSDSIFLLRAACSYSSQSSSEWKELLLWKFGLGE